MSTPTTALAIALLMSSFAIAAPQHAAGVSYVEVGPRDAPLIVALHWQGGDPVDLCELLGKQLPKFHIVAPYADAKNGAAGWYLGGSGAKNPAQVVDAAARIAAFIKAIAHEQPVILTGYSQGAIIALTIVIRDPSLVRAAVVVSGRIPPSLLKSIAPAAARPPIRLLHGARDVTIPFASGRDSAAALTAAGFPVVFTPYPDDAHGLSAERIADWIAALAQL